MDKGVVLAIIGSIIVFVIIMVVMFYSHSDFDQQLMEQVDHGVPAEKLIPQIDKETEKLKENAQNRLVSKVFNKNFVNGNLSSNDNENYMITYQDEMKMISECDEIRKKFAKREITKEQFLQDIKNPKEFIEMLN